MQIAIGMPVGYPVGSAKAAGIFNYLVNDTFTTDRAAGAVNGTLAEPGPGVRVVVDTDADALLLTGGVARFQNPNSINGNPGLWYGGQGRSPGLLVKATAVYSAFSGFSYPIGWDADQTTLGDHQFRVTSAGSLQPYQGSVGPVLATLATGTHTFAVVLRAIGAFYFAKISGTSNYLLYWITDSSSFPSMKPTISNHSQTSFDLERVVVPSARWLPTPLISDGFSVWGTSNGLGHAEGVAGGLGAGGSGKAWTANVGTWGASGGVAAASALSGGRAIATADCGKADVVATVECTLSSGTQSIIVRWASESNFVQLRLTSTNLQLVKVVAGVETIVQNSAVTVAAGAPVRLTCEGTKFRCYYNNALVGSEQTISDAALQSPTAIGLRTDNTGNTFDNLVAYARGSGGEYAALDAY